MVNLLICLVGRLNSSLDFFLCAESLHILLVSLGIWFFDAIINMISFIFFCYLLVYKNAIDSRWLTLNPAHFLNSLILVTSLEILLNFLFTQYYRLYIMSFLPSFPALTLSCVFLPTLAGAPQVQCWIAVLTVGSSIFFLVSKGRLQHSVFFVKDRHPFSD